MTTAVAWRRMVATEGKLVWRDPAGVFLPLALPLLIIAMYGLSSGDDPADGTGGLPAVSAIAIPTGFATIVAILGLVNVPSFLAAYRKDGVLRRLAVTPARPSMVLAAQAQGRPDQRGEPGAESDEAEGGEQGPAGSEHQPGGDQTRA